MWNEWKSAFNILDKHIPFKNRRVKSSYVPWLTSAIKKENVLS